jgi:hypothetical protein
MKPKKQTPQQLQAAIVALSGQLADTRQLLNLEKYEHLRFLNQLRAQVLGFKELPLDATTSDLLMFREDLVRFLQKVVQVATNVNHEAAKQEDKKPVAAPFLG